MVVGGLRHRDAVWGPHSADKTTDRKEDRVSVIGRAKFQAEKEAWSAYGRLLDEAERVERLFAIASLPLPDALARMMLDTGPAAEAGTPAYTSPTPRPGAAALDEEQAQPAPGAGRRA